MSSLKLVIVAVIVILTDAIIQLLLVAGALLGLSYVILKTTLWDIYHFNLQMWCSGFKTCPHFLIALSLKGNG